jgi:hypothetical protein
VKSPGKLKIIGDRVVLLSPASGDKMSKQRLALDWSIKSHVEDFKPTLIRYRKYFADNKFRSSIIDSYVGHVGRFLEFAHYRRCAV